MTSSKTPESFQKRKFIKRGSLFLVLFILLHYLLVSLFEYQMMSQDFFMWRWKHQVADRHNKEGETDYQILWIGDSRVLGAVNPIILSRGTGKTMVNLAGGGMQFPAMYFLLKRYLKTHTKPELVFLSQAPYAWNRHDDFFEHQLKFAISFIEYRELFFKCFFKRWNLLLQYPLFSIKSVYAFNPEFRGSLFRRSAHNREVERQMREQLGFRAWSDRQLQESDSLELQWKFEPDPLSLEYCEKIFQLCQQEQIRLIYISMPFPESRIQGLTALKSSLLPDYLKTLQAFQKKYSFQLIEELEARPDSEFSDFSHLNNQGAENYSKSLVPKIIEWLKY